MARYVLVNRRAGKFTPGAKIASRAAIATTLGLLENSRILADRQPPDDLARGVVLLEADPAQISRLKTSLPPDAILEPAIERHLHRRTPIELRRSLPMGAHHRAPSSTYRVTITGGGQPLVGIEVMLYLRDPGGQIRTTTVKTGAAGGVAYPVPPGYVISFVEPIPYSGFWIMLAEAPMSGSVVDCAPVAGAGAGGGAWWHGAMGVDVNKMGRGQGIKVGVIDTGCGPHRNLAHVNLVGAFVDGRVLEDTNDVAEHGTHTTGIIGARITEPGDYTGMAPDCDLFHA